MGNNIFIQYKFKSRQNVLVVVLKIMR